MTAADPRDRRRGRLFTAIAFCGPLLLYLATTSAAVQFDDCAELVLCAREGSAAHPPGYPLWVALAGLWLVPFGFLGTLTALAAFASVCTATATAVLYRTFEELLRRAPANGENPRSSCQWPALFAALACATGATVWQWSNTVEIYSLQLLATALATLGTVRGRLTWTAIGLGIGLANYHLATIVLLPFLALLDVALRRVALVAAIRALLPALAIATGIAVLAYLLMMLRSGGEVQFTFGEPSTFARLWHHLSGGFFADGILLDGVDYAGRAEVYAWVLVRQLWLFALPFGIGVAVAWQRRRALLWFGLGYPAALIGLQYIRIYTPNMDASVLPAFVGPALLVALGLRALGTRRLLLFSAVALGLQLGLNLGAGNRRGYGAGDAVLADLDASTPQRSIVLLSSWELQTLSRLAIAEHGFRPDLIIVPSSLKGTHRDLLARHYPEFYRAIAPEYEAYLAAIAAVNPDYVYTDYFRIGSAAEQQSYTVMIRRLLAIAATERRAVLCDRVTFKFLLDGKIIDGRSAAPCGMLFSIGTPVEPRPFPEAPGWLDHPFLRHDLCAFAMLHDYRSTAAQAAGYFEFRGQGDLAAASARAQRRLESTWADYIAGKPAARKAP